MKPTEGSDSTGSISFAVSTLSLGNHAITATVTDTVGLYAEAMVLLDINALPSTPVVEIEPDPATSADELVATITTESTDSDGDKVSYSFAWSVDGGPSKASTSDILPASATAAGEIWTVEVTPNDGAGDGSAGSDSITISNTDAVQARLEQLTILGGGDWQAATFDVGNLYPSVEHLHLKTELSHIY